MNVTKTKLARRGILKCLDRSNGALAPLDRMAKSCFGRDLRFTRFVRILILVLLYLPMTANAQAWKQGRTSIMKNDFKSALTQLKAALKASKSKTELAETHKFLGVAQYMAGQKSAATSSFQTAKNLNPSIQLTDGEVVDDSVLPIFKAATVAPAKTAAPAKKLAPAKTLAPGRTAPTGQALSKVKSKKTVLRVNSNVPNAKIELDGIAYGSSGEEIEVVPGVVILTVSARGYISKGIRVSLDPLTSSTLEVILEKIPKK